MSILARLTAVVLSGAALASFAACAGNNREKGGFEAPETGTPAELVSAARFEGRDVDARTGRGRVRDVRERRRRSEARARSRWTSSGSSTTRRAWRPPSPRCRRGSTRLRVSSAARASTTRSSCCRCAERLRSPSAARIAIPSASLRRSAAPTAETRRSSSMRAVDIQSTQPLEQILGHARSDAGLHRRQRARQRAVVAGAARQRDQEHRARHGRQLALPRRQLRRLSRAATIRTRAASCSRRASSIRAAAALGRATSSTRHLRLGNDRRPEHPLLVPRRQQADGLRLGVHGARPEDRRRARADLRRQRSLGSVLRRVATAVARHRASRVRARRSSTGCRHRRSCARERARDRRNEGAAPTSRVSAASLPAPASTAGTTTCPRRQRRSSCAPSPAKPRNRTAARRYRRSTSSSAAERSSADRRRRARRPPRVMSPSALIDGPRPR